MATTGAQQAQARPQVRVEASELDPQDHDTLNCRQYWLQQAWSDTAGGSALADCPNLAPQSATCHL